MSITHNCFIWINLEQLHVCNLNRNTAFTSRVNIQSFSYFNLNMIIIYLYISVCFGVSVRFSHQLPE